MGCFLITMEVRIKVINLKAMSTKQKKILMDESRMIDSIAPELIHETFWGGIYFAYIVELQDELRGIMDAVGDHRIKPEELDLMSHALLMDNVDIRSNSFLGIFFSSKKELMVKNRLKYVFIRMLQAAMQGDKEQINAVTAWCRID